MMRRKRPTREQFRLDCHAMTRAQIMEKYGVNKTSVLNWSRMYRLRPLRQAARQEVDAMECRHLVKDWPATGSLWNRFVQPNVQLDYQHEIA